MSRNSRLLVLVAVIAVAIVGAIVAAVLGHGSPSKTAVTTLPPVTTPATTTTAAPATTSSTTTTTATTTTTLTPKQKALAELRLERKALALLFGGIPQHGTILGKPSAPATLAIYEDPQCPYCQEWNLGTLPTVIEQFVRTGKVKLEYRGIEIIGPNSAPGLRAIEAAGLQNRLWYLNEAFYEHQGKENSGWITAAVVAALGEVAGTNVTKLFADANSAAVTAALKLAGTEATADKVGGTPTFVLQNPPALPKVLQVTALDPTSFDAVLTAALG